MATRRSILNMGAAGAAAVAAGLKGFIDPFGVGGPSDAKAIAGFAADGESFHEFVLLPFGAAAPVPTGGPTVLTPRSEGRREGGFESLSAPAAARRFDAAIPVLNAQGIARTTPSLHQGLTHVRSDATGRLVWARTDYFLGAPDARSRPLITLRADNGFTLPIPVWPSGSPASGTIPPSKADYLPSPGIVVSQGPSTTALWVQHGSLMALELDASLLSGASVADFAPFINIA